ncbi:MAG TPA: biotin/lipoyl-containing protein, partial [Agromyces sp.]|nr:biotin/lipoyl-containing protein [Agromyces sp.]
VVSTRDCSLQRRHQKLVEEAPAPFLTEAQNTELYRASKAILKEVGYVGAGTCEFLIGKDGTVSFLEVNTRLQVEHPVSEEVTGIDLVREQFRIAEGGLLDPVDPVTHGHSIEFRINGEDPGRNFMPTPGPVHVLRFPGGPGVRVDSGVTTGDVISGSFDSLLAKLIVTGHTRADALERARRALDEFEVAGLPTVLPFHRDIVRNPAFAPDGDEPFSIFTRWIETEYDNSTEPWSGEIAETTDPAERTSMVVEVAGRRVEVTLPKRLVGGASAERTAGPAPRRRTAHHSVDSATGDAVKAPMQATVVKVAVAEGDKVVKGDLVLVLEAMKMEQPILAHKDGVVGLVNAEAGATVSSGHLLLAITDAPAA